MKSVYLIFFMLLFGFSHSQSSNKIFTSDIDNFWVAYDSIQKTHAFSKKLNLINKLYIDKGTKGLKEFMKLRDYNDSLYIKSIEEYPKFWNSIRPNTLTVKNKITEFENAVQSFQKLYPELKNSDMYFTIGVLNSGGTITDNMVLIGAEISMGTSKTDVSEFKSDWLKNVFASQDLNNIVSVNIHEYVHTQQKPRKGNILMNQVIREGSCDFITELVLRKPLQRKYITYGKAHFPELKKLFKKEMFSNSYINWLYNGNQKGEAADLGYFMGYQISKSYYKNARNKKQAIKDIIELNYSDDLAVEGFLKQSNFYKEGFNKEELVKEYHKNSPYIVKIQPFENGSGNVDPTSKKFRIVFSKEMNTKRMSIKLSEKGKEVFPFKQTIGFENDDKILVMEMSLKPDSEYEFIIGNEFMSKDGHPLIGDSQTIRFKTK